MLDMAFKKVEINQTATVPNIVDTSKSPSFPKCMARIIVYKV